MPGIIDLRSDTVTQPTQAMREAMYRAEVGDDGFGDDPTVNRLEAMAAEKLGKEAAVFVTSGTQANLVCLLSHTQRGDEVILGDEAHIMHHEMAGSPTFGSLMMRTVPNQPDGTLRLEDVQASVRPAGAAFPRSALVCIENTQNRCGGAVLTPEYTASLADLAHRHNIAVHLDGARIFNAAIKLDVDVKQLVGPVDSVGFCLSKGLSCPVGSIVCGSKDFIARARKWRKAAGGGLRQVGIIAAAGIVALEQMIDRLAEDHENARVLAQGLAEMPGIQLDPATVHTNIVYFEFVSQKLTLAQLTSALAAEGIKTRGDSAHMRFVTHYGIDRADVDRVLSAIRKVLS